MTSATMLSGTPTSTPINVACLGDVRIGVAMMVTVTVAGLFAANIPITVVHRTATEPEIKVIMEKAPGSGIVKLP
jgi:hypothetical protein